MWCTMVTPWWVHRWTSSWFQWSTSSALLASHNCQACVIACIVYCPILQQKTILCTVVTTHFPGKLRTVEVRVTVGSQPYWQLLVPFHFQTTKSLLVDTNNPLFRLRVDIPLVCYESCVLLMFQTLWMPQTCGSKECDILSILHCWTGMWLPT